MRRLLLLLVASLLFVTGCANDVGDIDRTQPNRVKKSLFTGEWYYRATIADVPPTAGFTFVGEQSDTEKITWEIQEEYLLAYRSYEHITDEEKYAQRPGVPWTGAPIAAYKILSHFDVQREYNAATGEQTNVISENTTDRPWYQRQFMRVDWSQNLIADFQFVTSTVKQNPVSYFVPENETTNPDHIQIGDEYIDIVNKMFVEPEIDEWLSEWYGMPIPACWLYDSVEKDCIGQAIKVRHSFMKAKDHTLAYEPLNMDDKDFAKFGFFRTDRYAYDRERDLLEGKTEHWINRFNIWVQSRRCVDASGADVDVSNCEPEKPAVKDPTQMPWQVAVGTPAPRVAAKLVSIPMKDRQVRPIVYFLNDQYPAELLPHARRIADQWDDVFRDTVANAWSTDGKPTRKEDVPRMFVLCTQNPVADGKAAGGLDLSKYDPAALPHPEFQDDRAFCGDVGTSPKIGDLRFSMIYWIPENGDGGLLGYGPLAADPTTGETLAANAFVYGAAHETYATYGADVVSLLQGNPTTQDFVDGKYLIDYLHRDAGHPGVYKQADKANLLREMTRSKMNADRVKRMSQNGKAKLDYVTANQKRLAQSRLADLRITDEMAKAMTGGRVAKASDLTPADRERLNATNWLQHGALERAKKRVDLLSRHNITAADFQDESVLSRALAYKAQGKNFEQVRQDLLGEIMVATTLHEVGHTFGLRHNFAGSMDPLNYFTNAASPEKDYWQLRKTESIVATPDGKLSNNPQRKKSMVPRYFETGTASDDDYLKGARNTLAQKGIRELQYSSIMDYGAEFNSDIQGLGKYDYAAIRFGYANLVEKWDFTAPKGTANLLRPTERHYTIYPELLDPEGKTLDEQVSFLSKRKVVKASEITDPDQEVPYRFCSDEYVGATPYCYRFDSGADMWESVANNIAQYENYYWFYNFKRGRVKFGLDIGGYLGRVYERHFDFLSSQFKHMTNQEFFFDRGQCGVGRFEENFPHYAGTDCGADLYLSSIDTLNFFQRVLARPDVGTYGFNPTSKSYEMGFDSQLGNPRNPKDEVSIGLGDGRWQDTYYSFERYGYDFYYKPVIVGQWWDKWLAIDALGDPNTYFIQDKATESLNYVFNFRVIFPNPVNNLVGSFITESLQNYAPRVDANGKLLYRSTQYWSETYAADPAGAKVLNPSEMYTARLAAAFDALMFFTDNYDQDFTYGIKIFAKGNGDGELPATTAASVEVVDPVSNRTFVGIKYQPLRAKLDARGRQVKDANGNPVFEPDPDFVPTAYEYLTRLKAAHVNDPQGLHDDLSFADIIRDAVHYYEYRE